MGRKIQWRDYTGPLLMYIGTGVAAQVLAPVDLVNSYILFLIFVINATWLAFVVIRYDGVIELFEQIFIPEDEDTKSDKK